MCFFLLYIFGVLPLNSDEKYSFDFSALQPFRHLVRHVNSVDKTLRAVAMFWFIVTQYLIKVSEVILGICCTRDSFVVDYFTEKRQNSEMITALYFTFVLSCVSLAQEVHFGKCVNFTTQENFDVERVCTNFFSTIFIYRSPFLTPESSLVCSVEFCATFDFFTV